MLSLGLICIVPRVAMLAVLEAVEIISACVFSACLSNRGSCLPVCLPSTRPSSPVLNTHTETHKGTTTWCVILVYILWWKT